MNPLFIAAALASSPVQGEDATPEFFNFVDAFASQSVHAFGMDFERPGAGGADFTTAGAFALLNRGGDGDALNWIPAFSYQYASLDLDATATPPGLRLDDDLHLISAPNIFLYQKPGSRWFHGLFVTPGVQSDLDGIDSRDFRLSAAFATGYRINDRLTLGAGVYGSNLTNDPFVVAAPGFFWRPDDRWLVAYYGPRFVARRDIGDRARLGFEAAWSGGNWSVGAGGTDARLDVQSLRAGIYYQHRIFGETWVALGLGYTFANEIELRSPGGRDIAPAALGELDPAPYVSLGVNVHRW